MIVLGSAAFKADFLQSVKDYATLSAAAHFDHGVCVLITEDHGNRAADRGYCVSTRSVSFCSDHITAKWT